MAYDDVNTSSNPELVKKFYDLQFLEWVKSTVVFDKFAQQRPLPKGKGTTIEFTRYRPLPIITSTVALDTTAIGTAGSLYTDTMGATLIQMIGWIPIQTMLSFVSIDPDVSEKVELVADQAARSIDRKINSEISPTALHILPAGMTGIADNEVRGKTSSYLVTTTAWPDTTNLVQATADWWGSSTVGGYLTCTDTGSKNYSFTRRITAFDATANCIESEAFPFNVNNTCTFTCVRLSALASTDVLSTSSVRKARRDLKINKAKTFAGGRFIFIINDYTEYDFMGQTAWEDAKQYSDVRDLYAGEIGEWMQFRFVTTQDPYREDTDATADYDDGAVHSNLALGMHSYGMTKLTSEGLRLIQKRPGPQTTSDPADMFSTIAWKSIFVPKTLNSCFRLNVLTGASS